MDVLDVARLQFGVTTVYHFLFVPITIGLSMVVALLQTMWRVTGRDAYLRATKFWGHLFLVTLAMGIVTGIVQEFQFGMNWSAYSRFVGDIFGAPLAFEALLAFFLEATFAGIWIFGWDKLKPSLHLACIWLVAFGTAISAYFILAANAFMQNPVGFKFNETSGRAELTDFWAILTNPVALSAFPHTLFASWLTAGMIVIGVSAWHFRRGNDLDVHRPAMRLGVLTSVVAGIGLVVSGDALGKVMTSTQPMKMAAAEALYETTSSAPFSVLSIGNLSGSHGTPIIEIPGLLSYLATGRFGAEVQGINDLQAQYSAQFGPGDYTPYVPLTYWSFRAMIGFGMLAVIIALFVWWRTRKGAMPQSRWFWLIAVWSIALPFVANSTGWIFTEMGRQPWVVFSLMLTEDGVSPTVSEAEVWTSFIGFTLVYAILAVVCYKIFAKYARKGPPDAESAKASASGPDDGDSEKPMAFAY
ncbi:cytochrome ubiquinol oxidase subunit I [Salininema proteolyticum]|uniref:Cytochrome ubiquinol oxidase subunit I n=1 Tax=Salininema proteolyticum TaxID=1607685 RepID=A0ABV8U0G2_9ACTN